MKRNSFGYPSGLWFTVALSLLASSAFAGQTHVVRRGGNVQPEGASASAVSYSVEVPVVTRVVGTALFRTAIDISNNTSSGTSAAPVVARFQYSYNRLNSDGTASFFRTPIQTINLLAFDNFHTDD